MSSDDDSLYDRVEDSRDTADSRDSALLRTFGLIEGWMESINEAVEYNSDANSAQVKADSQLLDEHEERSEEHDEIIEAIENSTIIYWPDISFPGIPTPFGGDRGPSEGYGGKWTRRAFLVGAAGLATGGVAAAYEAQDGYDFVVGEEAVLNSIGRRYIDSGYGNLEELGHELLENQESDRILGFDDGIFGGGRIGLQAGEEKLGVDSQHIYEEAKSIAEEEAY